MSHRRLGKTAVIAFPALHLALMDEWKRKIDAKCCQCVATIAALTTKISPFSKTTQKVNNTQDAALLRFFHIKFCSWFPIQLDSSSSRHESSGVRASIYSWTLFTNSWWLL